MVIKKKGLKKSFFFIVDSCSSENNTHGLFLNTINTEKRKSQREEMKMGNTNDLVYSTDQNGYWLEEKKYGTPHRRKCIDGSVTGCGKCVGYCTYVEHPGFLTKKLRKEHDCLKKRCYYYQGKEARYVPITQVVMLTALAGVSLNS